MKKLGPNFEEIQRKKIKYAFTYGAMIYSPKVIFAKYIMSNYLLKTVIMQDLISKQRIWRSSFLFIQKRMKATSMSKYSKVKVIQTYWNKLFGMIMKKASQKKDKQVLALLTEIVKVPEEVQKAACTYYVNKCQ